jgi:molybdenum cofactor sulfurtransferase
LEGLENQAVAIQGSGPIYNLFAFPPEDNYAGVKYPLRWVEGIKAKSTAAVEWKVLLDAAAYVPTQPLDLSQVPADFVSLSFYKMFGYPTGLGALLVRVDAAELLQKVRGQGSWRGLGA